jgi:hypothetical protein
MECWGSRQFVRTRGIVLDTLACGPEVPGSIPEREISLSKKFTHIAHRAGRLRLHVETS